MTQDRKPPRQPDRQPNSQQNAQPNQTTPRQTQHGGAVEDPLKAGMTAAGGQVLHGAGMYASAQQSGRGLGESSMPRNWDAGGQPGQDNRGTVSTGPDTAPKERARQQDERRSREQTQQQAENAPGTRTPGATKR
ncbi:hypothetical protein [Pedomonas sp. V897]|mgnify:CR=1 FL=1|uniref:hypothetical protein n=1 Tax=Pedomonas sp. V897 TaxID=3446482 RepID=UPI003EDFC24B